MQPAVTIRPLVALQLVCCAAVAYGKSREISTDDRYVYHFMAPHFQWQIGLYSHVVFSEDGTRVALVLENIFHVAKSTSLTRRIAAPSNSPSLVGVTIKTFVAHHSTVSRCA